MRTVKAVAAVLIWTTLGVAPGAAVAPPELLTGPPPADSPGPEFPMRQDKGCLAAGLLPGSDPARVPPPEDTLNLAAVRALNRGGGVTVAILDTGISPHTRLPALSGGGDFVLAEGDGLSDCDAHGTLIAGIIGAASAPGDAFTGVAPDAQLLSIRVRSGAFTAERPVSSDAAERIAVEVRTLARAITRAANLGAGVIAVPLPVCVPASLPVDQSVLSAAVGYATRERGALIVTGAGTAAGGDCAQNPGPDPARPADPRNWGGVGTIATPGWFAPAVLTVAATAISGAPLSESLAGPWVSLAAPGAGIESLGPGGGGLINGVGAPGQLVAVGGAAYATAYVAGVAALLRSRYPGESPQQIAERLRGTAHAPARGADNFLGAGVIDPLAALSSRTPPPAAVGMNRPAALILPPSPREPDTRPAHAAVLVAVLAVLAGVAGTTAALLRRKS